MRTDRNEGAGSRREAGPGKPAWLKKKLPPGGGVRRVERVIRDLDLHTVCHGAKCPNRNDCFQQGTATFLILGDSCTRRCRFCSIPKKTPPPPDPEEPARLAEAVARLRLSFAVITSVTRDDLPDGGASQFAAVIRAVRERAPRVGVEVLVPDFGGSADALRLVLEAGPAVLNHNVETVPSLYASVRPGADYGRSLELLGRAAASGALPVKSGIMLGLGETEEEVEAVLRDLRFAGVALLTLGQYLQPGPDCLEVRAFLPPERFARYAETARRLGFAGVSSGPFVRSSHGAGALYKDFLANSGRSE